MSKKTFIAENKDAFDEALRMFASENFVAFGESVQDLGFDWNEDELETLLEPMSTERLEPK